VVTVKKGKVLTKDKVACHFVFRSMSCGYTDIYVGSTFAILPLPSGEQYFCFVPQTENVIILTAFVCLVLENKRGRVASNPS
jgi:hypothetical protein